VPVLQYLIDISGGLQVMVQFISNLTYEVKSGNIPMSQSDDVVARIFQVKFETGLFEHPYANKGLKSFIGQQVITCPHDS
jgi:beta-glucosidase-like glycosyl hydrolase